MLPIDFHSDAGSELGESFDWYAQRSERAAQRFVNAVDAALVRVSTDSTVFPFIDAVHQACPVKKFPYRIVFRVCDGFILVVAVAHAKRRPGFWRSRDSE